MRLVVLLLCLASACTDVRTFEGTWQGPRVGSAAPLDVGVAGSANATLAIDKLDNHGISGRLSVDGLVLDAPYASVAGAEADALAGMTFDGSPSRVYLAFVAITDGGGEALAIIALYDDKRVEVRVIRGGAQPLYGIFALARAEGT